MRMSRLDPIRAARSLPALISRYSSRAPHLARGHDSLIVSQGDGCSREIAAAGWSATTNLLLDRREQLGFRQAEHFRDPPTLSRPSTPALVLKRRQIGLRNPRQGRDEGLAPASF